MSSKIVVAGGTGLIGNALTHFLSQNGYDVVVLSRKPSARIKTIVWDGVNPGPWTSELNGARAVINLSGRSIDCRPTEKNKQEILDSRVKSTLAIGQAIEQCQTPPEVWINSSAVGYYGDTKADIVTERSTPGTDFIAHVCIEWEKALNAASTPATRKIALRTGMVLSQSGGALPELLKFARLGLGGPASTGNQYVSWIHLTDLIAIISWLLNTPEVSGPVNAVSPGTLKNKELMSQVRKKVKMPLGLPQPRFILKFGAWVIDTNPDLVLNSAYVKSEILEKNNFRFKYPLLELALNA